MTDREFTNLCLQLVADYTNQHMDKTDCESITTDNVYMVWSCKTLQNWKALLSTMVPDGMYYEVTFNGDRDEVYLDAYKKFENKCFHVGTKEENNNG